jgi:hypothetical protein
VARLWAAMNSRAKGKRGEQEFINLHLRPLWPDACRNVDQFGADKRDCLHVGGVHWQIKRTEGLRLWQAIAQAEGEAAPGDVPVVAFRRNATPWYCSLRAETLVPLLRVRENLWIP